ncbi:carbohydrate-binding module family 50 protein [Echria macrotheca]|uniref:Carbohydrate-binding module family 50 protein n=1 Tax=Echria macrotheca TaxID=438768 RepID=A0AAJ0BE62_9PEZI|nr:carbohydrate-binding module family 50 protein [Echria macrotheca]
MHLTYIGTWPIDGLSSSCISVLNQGISCDPYLLDASPDKWEPESVLKNLCTPACDSAWATYLRRINGACGTSRYDGGDGFLYLPAREVEPFYETYRQVCLKNSAGKFCNTVLQDVLKIDPNTGVRSSEAPPLPSSAACEGCFLSNIAQALQMPMSSDGILASSLSSFEAFCSTSVSRTSPAQTTWSISASTTGPSPSGCDGTLYAIKSGETCQSIALSQGYSTSQLIAANGLTAYCRNFPKSGSICLPRQLKCKPYAPVAGDTCNTIGAQNDVSFAQMVSWNPEVGQLCGNMGTIISKSMIICLSNPGGSWTDPNSSQMTTTSTSKPSWIYTASLTPMTDIGTVEPSQTSLPSDYFPGGWIAPPLENGTRSGCMTYITPPVLVDAATSKFSYECSAVAKAYGVSLSDFLDWNPGINQTGGFNYPCELLGNKQYCVLPTIVTPSDTTANCSVFAAAEPSWTCQSYGAIYNITEAAIIAWNPSVGKECKDFRLGTTYCAAVDHFTSPDTISTCSFWATAGSSTPQVCSDIEAKYKLDHRRFVAWNPSILNDCSGAVRGYDYCVGTPSFHPGFA